MAQSYPDAGTVLGATADYLEGTLYPKLSGTDRYFSRVAINALRIVQREIALGKTFDAAGQNELRDFLGDRADNRPLDELLAEDIRLGRCDLQDPALVKLLTDSLRRSLEINNPKWIA